MLSKVGSSLRAILKNLCFKFNKGFCHQNKSNCIETYRFFFFDYRALFIQILSLSAVITQDSGRARPAFIFKVQEMYNLKSFFSMLVITANVLLFSSYTKAQNIIEEPDPDRAIYIPTEELDSANGGWVRISNNNWDFTDSGTEIMRPNFTEGSRALRFHYKTIDQYGIVYRPLVSEARHGRYKAYIDVGEPTSTGFRTQQTNNSGFYTGGINTSRGTRISGQSVHNPSPAHRTWHTWHYTYDLMSNDSRLGNTLGFSFQVDPRSPSSWGSWGVMDNLRYVFIPSVKIEALSQSIYEGNVAAFTISLGGPVQEEVTVEVSRAASSSVDQADIAFSSETLTFAPGQTTQTLLVEIVEDGEPELTENLIVALSNVTGPAIIDTVNTAELQVLGSLGYGEVTLSVTATNAHVGEGGRPITFVAELNEPLFEDLTFEWILHPESTAVAADIDSSTPASVTISAGDTRQEFEILIYDDPSSEGTETAIFRFEIVDGPLVFLSDQIAVSITDNEISGSHETISVPSAIYVPTDGDVGHWVVRSEFSNGFPTSAYGLIPQVTEGSRVLRLNPSSSPFRGRLYAPLRAETGHGRYVAYIDIGNETNFGFPSLSHLANSGFYSRGSATLEGYRIGEQTSSLPIPNSGKWTTWSYTTTVSANDPTVGTYLGFVFDVQSASSATTAAMDNLRYTFIPSATISASSVRVNESKTAAYIISLGGPATDTVTVDIGVSGTSTADPSDYDSVPTSVTFAPGEMTKSVLIHVVDDDNIESDETLVLELTGIRGMAIMDAVRTATVNLVSDEAPPTVPGAPSLISASPGNQQIEVVWETPNNNGGSEITDYAYSFDGSLYTYIGSTSTSYTITGLTNGTSYPITIRAVNSQGFGAPSEHVLVTPDSSTIAPSAPNNVVVTPLDGRVRVTWEPPINNGGAAIIRYHYTLDGGVTVIPIGGGATARSLTLLNLLNGQSMTYSMFAENSVGSGPLSDLVTVTPAAPPSAPTIDANIAISDGQLTLSWSAPVEDGGSEITGYQYSLDGVGYVDVGSATSVTIDGLVNGLQYTISVRAVNSAHAGVPSSVTATPNIVPSAPTIDRIASGNMQLEISWIAPRDNGGSLVTGYKYSINGSTYADLMSADTTATINQLPDGGGPLINGTDYSITLLAYNQFGDGEISEPVTFSTGQPPDAPTDVTVRPGIGVINVSWTASNDNASPITTYQYSIDGSNYVSMGTRTEFQITQVNGDLLVKNQEYSIRVRAVNAFGESEASRPVLGKAIGVPDTPENIVATPGNREISLSWVPAANDGGSEVINYRYKINDEAYVDMNTTATSFTIRNMADGTALVNTTEYSITIVAVNEYGYSLSSDVVTVVPVGVPYAPYVTSRPVFGALQFDWVPPSNNGGSVITGYKYRFEGGGYVDVGFDRSLTITQKPNGLPLDRDVDYSVSVLAVNQYGNGDLSEEITARPLGVPFEPVNVVAHPGDRQIEVTFYASYNGGSEVTGYRYSIDGSSYVDVGDFRTFGGAHGRFTITHLANGTPLVNDTDYAIRVRAVNGYGDGDPSAEVLATPFGPPSAPENVVVRSGDRQLEVSWTPPSDNSAASITGYKYSIDDGAPVDVGASTSVIITELSDGTPLINGVNYSISLVAANLSGDGIPSDAQIKAPSGPPSAPVGVLLSPSDGVLNLTWEAPENDGGSPIERYEYKVNTRPYVDVGLNTFVSINPLTNGQEYTVSVRAVSSQGAGLVGTASASPSADVTVPTAPRNLVVRSYNGEIAVSWSVPGSDGGADITGYEYRINGGSYVSTNKGVETSLVISTLEDGSSPLSGTEYSVSVRAVNAQGAGDTSTQTSLGVSGVPTISSVDIVVYHNSTSQGGERYDPGLAPHRFLGVDVTLNWSEPSFDGGSAITGYKYSIDGSDYVEVDSVNRSITIDQLPDGSDFIPNRNYSFRVIAVNSYGDSQPSAAFTKHFTSRPWAVRDFQVIEGDGKLTLNWRSPANHGGGGIRHYVLIVNNAGYNFINSGATSFELNDLVNGQTYTIALLAANNVTGYGEYTIVYATPNFVVEPPSAPQSVTSSPGDGQLTLNWLMPKNSGGSEITGYGYSINGEAIVDVGTATTATIRTLGDNSPLINGTEYSILIRARNEGGGYGDASREVLATPSSVPGVPTNLVVSGRDGQLDLSWVAPNDDGGAPITNYKYSINGGDYVETASTDTAISINELPDGRVVVRGASYSATVIAVNRTGDSVASQEGTGTVLGVPFAPENVEAIGGNRQLQLSWDVPSNNGGAGIESYKYSINGSAYFDLSGADTTTTITRLPDGSELINASRYFITVLAVNQQGDGDPARPVVGIPHGAPDAPLDVSITPGDTQLTLNWSAPANNGGSPIERYEYMVDGGDVVDVGLETSTVIRSLTNEQSYTLNLRAVNGLGLVSETTVSGTPSNAVTVPSAPRDVAVISGDSELIVAWSPPETNGGSEVTGYEYKISNASDLGTYVGLSTGRHVTISEIGDSDLVNGVEYTVVVRAINAQGAGSDSAAQIGTPSGVPDALQNVAVSPADRALEVTVTAPLNNGGFAVTGYEYSINGGDYVDVGLDTTFTVDQFLDGASLVNTVEYTLMVRAINDLGVSEPFGPVSGKPVGKSYQPEITDVLLSNQAITVRWVAPRNNGGSTITSYKYSIDGGPYIDTGSVDTSFTITQLSDGSPFIHGVRYPVTILAVNEYGDGDPSEEQLVFSVGPPHAPTGLVVESGDRQLEVSWVAPENTGGYTLRHYEYSINGGAYVNAGNVTSVTITSLSDGTPLANLTEYSIRVRAVSRAGLGNPSEAVSGIPVGTPQAPQDIEVVSGDRQLDVSWSAPINDSNSVVTGYKYSVNGGAYVDVGTRTSVTITQLDDGSELVNTADYHVRVLASNQFGDGIPSDPVSGTPLGTPYQPTDFKLYIDDGQLGVSWSSPANDGGFPITYYEYKVNNRSYVNVGLNSSTVIYPLNNGEEYTISLRAVNSHGAGLAVTSSATPVADVPIPGVPRGLTATPIDGGLFLTWLAPESGSGSPVTSYQYNINGGEYVDVGAARIVTINQLANGNPLVNGTPYSITVRGQNTVGGDGNPSDTIVGIPGTLPGAPTNVVVRAGGRDSLFISWDAPVDTGGSSITNYKYSIDSGDYVDAGPGTSVVTSQLADGTPTVRGTEYAITVIAVNHVGDSEPSVVAVGKPTSVTSPVTDVAMMPGDGQLEVRWSAPLNDGGTPIVRYEYRVNAGEYQGVGLETSVVIDGLTNGQEYAIYVRPVNEEGFAGGAVLIYGTPTTLISAPTAPRDVRVTAGVGELIVSWTIPESSGGSDIIDYEYNISGIGYVSTGSTDTNVVVTQIPNGAPLVRGVDYSPILVRAGNAEAGFGPASAPALGSATPLGLLDAPTDVSVTAGLGQLEVSWMAPSGDSGGAFVTGYRYSLDGGETYIDTGSTDTNLVIDQLADGSPLMSGVEYPVTVVAVNEYGESVPSSTQTGTPFNVPSKPQSVVVASGDQQLDVSWLAPDNDGGSEITGYMYRLNGGAYTSAGTGSSLTITQLADGSSLTNGVEYTINLIAVNIHGSGMPSQSVLGVPMGEPGAPTNLRVSPSSDQLTVRWSTPDNDGGSAIRRYEYRVDGGEYQSVGLETWVVIGDLTNGQAYSVDVRAVNGESEGIAATVGGTPISGSTVGSAPRHLTVISGEKELIVVWSTPETDGGSAITSYEYSINGEAYVDTGSVETRVTISQLADGSSLVNGTEYSVTVRAVNAEGKSEDSEELSGIPLGVPDMPENVTVTPGDRQLNLSWLEPSNTGGFDITGYEYSLNSEAYVEVGNINTVTIDQLSDGGKLVNGTQYSLAVRAMNDLGVGDVSTVAGTPIGTAYAPEITEITGGNQHLVVNWMAPRNNGGSTITSYKYSINGGAYVNTGSAETRVTINQLADGSNLVNGTQYSVTILAVNEYGDGDPSEEQTGTPVGPPEAPQNVSLMPADQQLVVNWDAPSYNGGARILRYEYSIDGGLSYQSTRLGLFVIIDSLTNGNDYTVYVRAVNSLGASGDSIVSGRPSAEIIPPSEPINVVVASGNGQLTVTWEEPESNGGSPILNYEYSINGEAYLRTNSAETRVTISQLADGSNLVNGTQYLIAVRARSSLADDVGEASGFVTGTPSAAPGAPTNVVVTPGDGELIVTWEEPESNGGSAITGYAYSLNGGAYVDTGSTQTRVTISQLSDGTALVNRTQYYITIRAKNGAVGFGDSSEIATGIPMGSPGAPEDLLVMAGDQRLLVSWRTPTNNGGSPITSYKYSINGGAYVDTGSAETRVTISQLADGSSLVNGVEYSIAVLGVNSQGEGRSSVITSGTPLGVPEAPVDMAVSPRDGGLMVSWSSPANDGGSAIVRYEYRVEGGLYQSVGLETSVVIDSLTNGQTYSVDVRAVSSIGESPSATASGIPTSEATAPGFPRSLEVMGGDQQLVVTWSEPETDGGSPMTSYEYSINGGVYVDTGSAETRVTINQLADGSSLVNGTAYSIAVRGVNGEGAGPASAAVTGTPANVPGAPTDVRVTGGDQQLVITWTAPGDNGGSAITSYEYSINGEAYVDTGSAETRVTISQLADGFSLVNGAHYTITIRAVNAVGSGIVSESGTGTPFILPGVPTNMVITAGNGELIVSWAAPEDNGGLPITGYQYKLDEGDFIDVGDVRSITIPDLEDGVEYTVWVRSVNALGVGHVVSGSVSTPGVPEAPTNVHVTIHNQQLVVTWTAPSNDGGSVITHYEYSINGGVFISAGNITSVTIAGVTGVTEYSIRLRAVNDIGPGQISDSVIATLKLVPASNTGAAVASQETSLNIGASIGVNVNTASRAGLASPTSGDSGQGLNADDYRRLYILSARDKNNEFTLVDWFTIGVANASVSAELKGQGTFGYAIIGTEIAKSATTVSGLLYGVESSNWDYEEETDVEKSGLSLGYYGARRFGSIIASGSTILTRSVNSFTGSSSDVTADANSSRIMLTGAISGSREFRSGAQMSPFMNFLYATEKMEAFEFTDGVTSDAMDTSIGRIGVGVTYRTRSRPRFGEFSIRGELSQVFGGEEVTLSNGNTYTPNETAGVAVTLGWVAPPRGDSVTQFDLTFGELGNDENEEVRLEGTWNRLF